MTDTLPAHWTTARLGDVYEFTRKPRDVRFADYPAIPFVPMEMIPIGATFFEDFIPKAPEALTSGTYFEPGDALIAKITPSFENGKQGIISTLPTPFGIATTEVIPVRGKPGVTDTLFLYYYLLHPEVRADLAAKMEGTTGRQRLNKAALENLDIPVPPLEEQQMIIIIIMMIERARNARRAEIDAERERKAALMEDLFTRGARGEATKDTEIGRVPESWEVALLGGLCEFLQYGTSQRCNGDVSETPVLRIPNVIGGVVDGADLKYISLSAKEADALRLTTGDVLFVRTNGRREYTGRSAVYKGVPASALFASYLIRARLKPDTVLPAFLQYYTMTPRGMEYLSGRASPAADGKFNINTQTIRGVLLPVPPLDEQREIVDVVAACDAKIAALEREAGLLDELFRAMLEELMTGRLSATPLISPDAVEASQA